MQTRVTVYVTQIRITNNYSVTVIHRIIIILICVTVNRNAVLELIS